MVARGASAEREAGELVMREIELRPDQAVAPQGIDGPPVAEEVDLPAGRGPPDENDAASRKHGRAEAPAGRPEGAGRGLLDPSSQPLATDLDVAVGVPSQGAQGAKEEPAPDFGGVEAVEVLDGVLQAELAGRDKDRRDAELEAQPDDAPENIRVLVRPLEAGIVVKLRVRGEAHRLPMGDQAGQDAIRARGGQGPRRGETAVQGYAREHIDERTARELEVLKDVEEIQLRTPARHSGQVPAGRGWGAPDPLAAVQASVTRQDASNRAHAGGRQPVVEPRAVNSGRPVLPQHALLAQLVPQRENLALHRQRRPIDRRPPARRTVGPVHAIKPLLPRASHPHLHGPQAHAPLPGYLSPRDPPANRGDHRAAARFHCLFLFIGRLPQAEGFFTTERTTEC